MSTQATTSDPSTGDPSPPDDQFQARCLAFLLSLPWRQAGLHFEWPVTDAVAKRVCEFLGGPIDDRQLESFVAKHPLRSSGWQPSDLVSLCCWANIRIQAPGEVSDE